MFHLLVYLALILSIKLLLCQEIQQVDISFTKQVSLYFDLTNVIMTFIKFDGTNSTLTVRRLDPISAIMDQVCGNIVLDDCTDITDNISHWLHGMWYTPSLPHVTREDYASTRIDVTKHFVDHYQYQDYLEIGTYKNELFNQAVKWFPNAIGVDPVEGGTLRMTSDAFFSNNSAYFDIVFVDGLHEANQVFKDVHNALEWLRPGRYCRSC